MNDSRESLPDYYGLLQVQRIATSEQIKAAYRRTVMKVHPDKGGTHGQMVAVGEAYAVLMDPQKRALYDDLCRNGNPSGGRASAAWESHRQGPKHQAEQYARSWEEFREWLDTAGREVAGLLWAQVFAGVFAGVVVGAALGAIAGMILYWGAGTGALVGTVIGGVGGGIAGANGLTSDSRR